MAEDRTTLSDEEIETRRGFASPKAEIADADQDDADTDTTDSDSDDADSDTDDSDS